MLERSEIEEGILDFATRNNHQKVLNIPMLPISVVAGLLEQMGFEQNENTGDETNGWQVDFWYYFERDMTDEGKIEQICLSGSLYYGSFKLTRV